MMKFAAIFKRKSTPAFFLLIALTLSILLFLIFRKDYGLSYDEILYYQYGDINFSAINKFIYGLPFDSLFNFYDLKYYGAAYLVVGTILERLTAAVFHSLDLYAFWHTLNFIVFLCGAWLIFCLGKHLLSERASLLAALLYLTQPLLWGHGVMNPKDIPFMVSFLAAVVMGMRAVDRLSGPGTDPQNPTASPRRKTVGNIFSIVLGLIALFSLADRATANHLTRNWVENTLSSLQTSASGPLLIIQNKLSSGLAAGIPIETYAEKILKIVNLAEFILIVLALVILLVMILKKLRPVLRDVLLAGLFLGLTSSIRVLGPAAGGLVILYALIKLKKPQFGALGLYLASALIVMYLSWPYLWVDPFTRFIECFKVMQNFPWGGSVLFNGMEYLATNLPWYYLSELISVQFTLPVLLLALFGSVLGLIKIFKKRESIAGLVMLFGWFFGPLLLSMIFSPTMYDNFRQFLFITPPLFILAGLGFDWLAGRVQPAWLKIALPAAILLPGIIAGAWLHPYEYVYYNALVGWTGNVGGRFENDYWGTSMCAAAKSLDQETQGTTEVALTDNIYSWMFKYCAKNSYDIRVERLQVSKIDPAYSIVSTRYGDDQDYFRSMKTVSTIGRGRTIFVVIKGK
jgi:hypothetical protein